MLLLFNPWRNLEGLKRGHNSFAEVFGAFESTMSDEVRDQIEHIQSYSECEWSSLLADAEGYSLFDGQEVCNHKILDTTSISDVKQV